MCQTVKHTIPVEADAWPQQLCYCFGLLRLDAVGLQASVLLGSALRLSASPLICYALLSFAFRYFCWFVAVQCFFVVALHFRGVLFICLALVQLSLRLPWFDSLCKVLRFGCSASQCLENREHVI